MCKKCCIIVFLVFAATCYGQQNEVVFLEAQPHVKGKTMLEREERTAINVGVMMGGGGLIGADLEFLVGKQVGLQLGAGLGSAGAGINYHFKPCINSQFISVVYWNQGFGDNHYASYLGPVYTFRARKIFQFGIGLGTVLSKGPGWERAWENKTNEPTGNMALLYNIGLFFPL